MTSFDASLNTNKHSISTWIEERHQDIFSIKNLRAFWGPTLSLIAYQLSIGLPFVICGVMIGVLGDSFSLGVFGLACTFVNLFFYSILNGVIENIGVHCSKLYSGKKYTQMGSYFWKGIFSLGWLMFFFIISVAYSYNLLSSISIQDNVAYATSSMLRASIPYLFLQAFNSLLVSYIASQSVTQPLIYINTASIVVVLFCAKFFIIDLKMKEIGFAYTKLVQEIINTICYSIVLVKFCDRNTLIIPTFGLVTKGIIKYLKGLGITILSFYGEFIGFEINTYFAALLHDISELALWCTLVNFSGIIFFISVGFSNAFRTFLGNLIGMGKYRKARTLSQHYLIYLAIFSMFVIVLLLVFKYQIGLLYTGDVKLASRMADILVAYSINIFPTLAFYSVASIYRLLAQDHFLFKVTTFVYPILVVSSSFVLCFPMDMKVYGINLGFSLSKLGIIIYMIYVLYKDVEWKAPVGVESHQLIEDGNA
jgi:Na+-driven multidrug efflux pump